MRCCFGHDAGGSACGIDAGGGACGGPVHT